MTDNSVPQDISFDIERQVLSIPEGLHLFRIESFEVKKGPAGPYIAYTCVCETKEAWNGQKIWLNISLSEKARFKLDEFLDAMEAGSSGKASPADFVRKTFKGFVELNDFEDQYGLTRSRPNIVRLLPPSAKMEDRSVSDDLSKLAKIAKKGKRSDKDIPQDVVDMSEDEEAF